MTVAFRYTSADLEDLPYVEGVRYEIIDGVLYVTTQPHALHQYTCDTLITALRNWIADRGSGAVFSAPGVLFTDDNNVAPDLVWYRGERWLECMDTGGHFHAAPDLMIEVLSPGTVNRVRDTELKLQLYSRQGVPEYWIADREAHSVRIHRQRGAILELVETLGDGDTLTSPNLPGFACPVSELWSPAAEPRS